jgi:monolysocardiolipin acyltransferase
MRWALGAEELLFNNLLFRAFFTAGRVLAVRRGHGIMQPNITRAIDLLDTGHWVHVFPEGRCNPDSNQLKDRLRWGVGKLILETKQPPLLVPIIHQGMEHIKPLNTWFPRIRKSLTITIGEPLETINLRNRLLADDKLNVNERRSRATDFVASQMSKYYQNGY